MFSAKLLICEEQKEIDCRKLLILRHLTLIMSLSCMLERNKIIVRDMSPPPPPQPQWSGKPSH